MHNFVFFVQNINKLIMYNIAILASGNGSNAENICRYLEGNKNISPKLIISNKSDAFVHERARNLEIPSVTFSKKEFDDGEAIVKLLLEHNIDFIVLSGFLLKISEVILHAYPNRIMNIHPALLPKYGGKGMYGDNVHKAVKANNEKETGITIHYVNDNYDEGDIIFQERVAIENMDTPDSIAQKVHQLEYKHFPSIIEKTIIQEFSKK